MKTTIKICVIGTGRVGRLHTRNLSRFVPGAQVTCMVDPVPEILKAAAEEFSVSGRYASLEDALENDRSGAHPFDAVIITTPTFTHRSLAVLAARHGKHVFLEKPMALNLLECDEILDAVQRGGVLLQMGFMRRFDPDFQLASERIRAGEIGHPMLLKSLTHGPGLPPAWARDLRTSNGMLAEVNSHDWDSLRWLAGSEIQRVYAEVANFKGPANQVDTPNFYDNALVNLRFENGALGSLSGICPCGYGYDARMEIVGEKGMLVVGELQGQALTMVTDRERGLMTPTHRTWAERFAWAYIYEMQDFIECVRYQHTPRVGGMDGRWAVAGVLAATKSLLEQRLVTLSEVLEEKEVIFDR
jgi:predicted dehydrogenase